MGSKFHEPVRTGDTRESNDEQSEKTMASLSCLD
jgi:hypothetical protein